MAKERTLPLGKSDFTLVRERNMYYVDKTEYIEKLESYDSYAILNRPRRFGKSLFLSALEKYYDLNTDEEEFDRLFKGLYIYDHKTEFAQQYMIMRFDFSRVKPGVTYDETEANFNKYATEALHEFALRYRNIFGETPIFDIYNPEMGWESMMNCISLILKDSRKFIYLIIDEYDNFTNTIMAEDPSQYIEITHSIGFLRSFFKMCKDPAVDRILLVGIAPVTHDDLTSGLSYCYPIGMERRFNAILGFTEREVREMAEYYGRFHDFGASTDEIVADMKPWYDNYCFSPLSADGERIYNTDAVLMYLKNFINTGRPPTEMTDPATAIDWKKIEMLSRNDNDYIINKLYDEGEYETSLVSRFDMNRMSDPDIFPSLLYYFGLATIRRSEYNTQTMVIPNNNVRAQFYERQRRKFVDMEILDKEFVTGLRRGINDMSVCGDWKSPFGLILGKWKDVSSVRQTIQGERAMQSFAMVLLSLSGNFLLRPEMELSKGYADIALFPDFMRFPSVSHSFIVELKVAKRDASDDDIANIKSEAEAQAVAYASDPAIPSLVRESKLHRCVIIMRGWDVEMMEEV